MNETPRLEFSDDNDREMMNWLMHLNKGRVLA